MKLIEKFENEDPAAKLTLELLWDGIYYLDRATPSRNLADAPASVWIGLLEKAVAAGRALKARELQLRTTDGVDPDELVAALSRLGFVKKLDRVEFRSPLSELPGDAGSPIQWKNAASTAEAASLLRQAAVGDPDYDPNDDAEALLKTYLSDPVLTGGPECVQTGFMDGEPMAIVIAQINPETKWSRITYMGQLPSHRGCGLGKWVHRHGFEMMRRQGGELYHGGTVSSNARMIALFREHGCKEYRRMREWVARS